MARFLVFAALATSTLIPAAAGAQSSTAAQAGPQRVTITVEDCRRLIRHVPAADVAYQPGVDVHGNKVAPADLPGSGGAIDVLPKVLEFNYTVNPTNWKGTGTPAAGLAGSNTQMPVAAIRYDMLSNTLTINGQPVGGPDEQAIAEECRKRGVK